MTKDILLVVDPQEGFISNEEIINNILQIWSCFDMVLVSKFISGNGLFQSAVGWSGLEESESKLQKDIKSRVKKYCVFEKDGYSALSNVDLREFFEAGDINSVYLAGFELDACILSTAYSLFDLGVQPIVITDCCGSNNEKIESAGLSILERNFGSESTIKSIYFK